MLNASVGRLVTREGEHTQQLPLASRACSSYEASFSAARYGLQIASLFARSCRRWHRDKVGRRPVQSLPVPCRTLKAKIR